MNVCKYFGDDIGLGWVCLFYFGTFRCTDGSISPCIRETLENVILADQNANGPVLTILCIIITILILLIAVFGGAIYFLR